MRLWFVATYGAIEMCFDWLIDWKHFTVQGYNSEENPFKIILFLCIRRILVRSATFDSHPAARGSTSWVPLGNWRHVVSDEQFLTSPFLPARFHLFSHQLKFFEGPSGPLRTHGPRGTCPGYPALSVHRPACTYTRSADTFLTLKNRLKTELFTSCYS